MKLSRDREVRELIRMEKEERTERMENMPVKKRDMN